jgi:hypothetical protein
MPRKAEQLGGSTALLDGLGEVRQAVGVRLGAMGEVQADLCALDGALGQPAWYQLPAMRVPGSALGNAEQPQPLPDLSEAALFAGIDRSRVRLPMREPNRDGHLVGARHFP